MFRQYKLTTWYICISMSEESHRNCAQFHKCIASSDFIFVGVLYAYVCTVRVRMSYCGPYLDILIAIGIWEIEARESEEVVAHFSRDFHIWGWLVAFKRWEALGRSVGFEAGGGHIPSWGWMQGVSKHQQKGVIGMLHEDEGWRRHRGHAADFQKPSITGGCAFYSLCQQVMKPHP